MLSFLKESWRYRVHFPVCLFMRFKPFSVPTQKLPLLSSYTERILELLKLKLSLGSAIYRVNFLVFLLNKFKPEIVPTQIFFCRSAYINLVWLLLKEEISFGFSW